MDKKKYDLPSIEVLESIKRKVVDAFNVQHQNIRSDVDALDTRGDNQEAGLRGRALENRRMLSEALNVFGQIECDISNQRQP